MNTPMELGRITEQWITSRVARVDRTVIDTMTLVVATTHSGYKVVGKSACVDPAQFNAEMGYNIALKDALDQLWALEGYLLAQQRLDAGLVKPVVGHSRVGKPGVKQSPPPNEQPEPEAA